MAERPTFLAAFRADPAATPLKTPSDKIEIYSERIAGFGYADCPGHPQWLEPREWLGAPAARRYPLHLLSNQPRNKLHSQYDHGSHSLKDKVQGREPIWMHPGDAAARLTDGLRPGVVQMATGAWYDPLVPGQIGTLDKHGSVNVLTGDRGTSRLAQGPSAQSALVEVEPYAGTPPPVTAHDPPRLL